MSERLSVLIYNFRFYLGARILPPAVGPDTHRIIAYGDSGLSDVVLRWFAGDAGDGGFGCTDPYCLCKNPVFLGDEDGHFDFSGDVPKYDTTSLSAEGLARDE